MAKKRAVIPDNGNNDPAQASAADVADAAAPLAGSDYLTRAHEGGTLAGYAIGTDGSLSEPTGTTTFHEWKPAEPTPVDPDPADIPAINITAARPAWEAEQSANVPGAGDPQNGVMIPDNSFRYIAWVDTSRDIAQHYPQADAQDAGP